MKSSNSSDENGSANAKKLSSSHSNQISVLKTLSRNCSSNQPRQYQINEIAELSGLRDEKEVQRYLFILEGQKLVSPYPPGDFTSKHWHITRTGFKALKTIETSDVN